MNTDRTSELVMKHLDGCLDGEEQREFTELSTSDPEFKKKMFEISVHHTMLYRMSKEQKLESAFRKRNKRSFFLPAAAAAVLIMVAGLFYLLFRDIEPIKPPVDTDVPASVYPEVSMKGVYSVLNGDKVTRNAVILAQERTEIRLGNYCAVEAAPETEFRIEGEPFAEHLYLEEGELVCEVDRNVGTFSVSSEAGTVYVTGTKFTVTVEKGEEMNVKNMFVKVMLGAVLVAGIGGDFTLVEGQEANTRRGGGNNRDMGRMFTSMRGAFGGSGTMVSEGDNLFVLSGATLARVNMGTYEIAAKIDLNEIGRDEAAAREAEQRKEWIKRFDKNGDGKVAAADGEFQGQWMSRFDKNNDSILTEDEVPVFPRPTRAASGSAVLTVAGNDLCMLRGGTLYIFGKTDLKFKKSLAIEEEKDNEDNPMMKMMQQGRGDHNRKPGGRDGQRKKEDAPKEENNGGGMGLF